MGNVYAFSNKNSGDGLVDRARQAGLPPHYCAKTLNAFLATSGTTHALDKARAFACALKPTRGLVFAGPTGVGKTHLAAGIALARLAGGGRVRFRRVATLLNEARDYAAGRIDRDPITRARDTFTLVLDDLGAERLTAFGIEQLALLIDYQLGAELPVIVTTNYVSPTALIGRFEPMEGHDAFVGERIVSRLRGMADWIVMEGPDHRLLA